MRGSPPESKLWLLRRLSLFDGFSDEQVEHIAAQMKERRYRARDEVIVRPEGDRVYLVKSGRVLLERGRVAVAVLGKGQLFGTSALFGAETVAERVTALEDDVSVCDAAAPDFLSILTGSRLLATRAVALLARQLSEVEAAIERATKRSVSARLADLLLRIAGDHPALPRFSEQRLAALVGGSRESASRLVAKWTRQGILGRDGGRLRILDEPALREIAEGPRDGMTPR